MIQLYICVYIYILFQILFNYRLLEDIEYSSFYILIYNLQTQWTCFIITNIFVCVESLGFIDTSGCHL